MNEQAQQDAYKLFQQGGYAKSFEEFIELINTNEQALGDAYTMFSNAGYQKSADDFSVLMGVKKKDTDSVLEDGSSELFSLDKPFQERLKRVDAQTVGLTEEPAVQQLNADFNDFGFEFSEATLALPGQDVVSVKAPNGKRARFTFDPRPVSAAQFSEIGAPASMRSVEARATRGMQSEEEKIQTAAEIRAWMSENMVQDKELISNIAKTLETSTPVYRNDEALRLENDEFVESVNQFNVAKDSLMSKEEEIMMMRSLMNMTEEENARLQALTEDYNNDVIAFNKRASQLNLEGLALQKKTSRYIDQKAEEGNFLGGAYNSFISGINEDLIGGGLKILTDIGFGIAKIGEDEEATARLTEQQRDLKASLTETGKNVASVFQTPNVTEQYIQRLQEESLVATGVFGAARSIPAFALPGGKFVTRGALVIQAMEAADREMQGEEWQNVSEEEKYLYKAPLALVTAALEDLGFRNIVNQKGLVSKLAFRALNRRAVNKSFAEFVQQDVQSALARGTLVAVSGALAEAETGGLQAVAEVNAKRLWNASKNSGEFETPEAFSREYYKFIAKSAAAEAIGGFVIGAPTAVRAMDPRATFSDELMQGLNVYRAPMVRDMSIAKAAVELSEGKITKEEYDAKVEDINRTADIINSVPEDADVSTQKQLYALLRQEADLKRQIANAQDPRLVKKETTQLKELQLQIEEVIDNYVPVPAEQRAQEDADAAEAALQEETDRLTDMVPDVAVEPSEEQDANLIFRAGNLETKAEPFANFQGGRSTGHFGTGFYFLSDQKRALDYARGEREVSSIDISQYNLARASMELHGALKDVNNRMSPILRPGSLQEGVSDFIKENGVTALEVEAISKIAGPAAPSTPNFDRIAENVNKKLSDPANIETPSALIMKGLGFDGINAVGTSLDNTEYGTVIYEIKPESVREVKQQAEAPAATPVTQQSLEQQDLFVRGKGLVNRARSIARSQLLARRFLPKSLFAEKEQSQANVAKSSSIVEQTIAKFNQQLKQESKSADFDNDAFYQNLDSAMRGGEGMNNLSPEMQEIVTSMRNQVDALTVQLIDAGVVDIDSAETNRARLKTLSNEIQELETALGKRRIKDTPSVRERLENELESKKQEKSDILNKSSEADKLLGNLGTYLTRSYKVFDNPKAWRKSLARDENAKIIEDAKRQIRDNGTDTEGRSLSERANAEWQTNQNPNNLSRDEYYESLIDAEVNKYIDPAQAKAFAEETTTSVATKKVDTRILKQRQDIPKEIRALMGEYSNPVQNYVKSVVAMTSTLEAKKYLNKIIEIGKDKFFFDGRSGVFDTQIQGTNSDLDGLYTTKELAEELTKVEKETTNPFLQAYFRLIGATKYSKTILSLGTHFKNLFGNMGFMYANGFLFSPFETGSEMYKSLQVVYNDLRKSGNEELNNKLNKYIELGIVKQSASIGELRDMFKDANWSKAVESRLNNEATGIKNFTLKAARAVGRGAENLYQAEDDFFKIVAYEMELKRQAKVLFNKSAESLNEQEMSQVESTVAEIVKNTFPTYSRVPNAIKIIRRNPLVGNFVAFQAESYRVAYNTFEYAVREVVSENPEQRKIGAKRLAGVLSYQAVKKAIMYHFAKGIGVGLQGLYGLVFDDEDESQRLDDIRLFSPPWTKKSAICVLDAGQGKITFVDLSASDPFGNFDRIINSVAEGESAGQAVAKGAYQVIEPFIGLDIATATFLDMSANKKRSGAPIWNPEADPTQQAFDVLNYLYQGTIEPGTIKSIRKIAQAENKGGELAGQLTGLKPYRVNVEEQLGYKLKDFRERRGNAISLRYDDPEKATEQLAEVDAEIRELMHAAERLGVHKKKIFSIAKEVGLASAENTRNIYIGKKQFVR